MEKKITVIKDGTTYLCNTYLSAESATPENGSSIPVLIDGLEYFVGLEAEQNDNASPLRVIKDDVTYYMAIKGKQSETELPEEVQYVNLTFIPEYRQKIYFRCNGVVEEIEYITGAKTLTVPVGAEYRIDIEAEAGYNIGEVAGIPLEGHITEDLDGATLTIGEATKKQLQVTINPPEGVTITVSCNGTRYTKDFVAEYGSTISFQMSLGSGYEGGTLKVNGSTELPKILTEAITVTVTDLTDVRYTVTLNKGEHIASVVMTVDGVEISSGAKVVKGKTLTVTATAEAGYADPTIEFI